MIDIYMGKCTEIGTRPRVRKFQRAERKAKALIEAIGYDECPYVMVQIDRYLNYFVKVIDGVAYPAILTDREAGSLGYGGQIESYNKLQNSDNVRDRADDCPEGNGS